MSMQDLAYAHTEPELFASYKLKPEDFQVREQLNFEPDGEGEHLFLLIEKKGLTTQDVQKILMNFFRLADKDVSYSGMKDKQAITQQWFSVRPEAGTEAVLDKLNSEQLRICRVQRNRRKLKRGSHVSNHFLIRLCDLNADAHALEERLQLIADSGVPNYFGEQRFGKNADNVLMAKQMFAGTTKFNDRYRRGIYLSAARAFLFNRVLSRRVQDGNWNTYIEGDVMSLDASSASFRPAAWDEVLAERLLKNDIHPSGPLWGSGKLKSQGQCAELEQQVLATENALKEGLEQSGLEQQRRALRSVPGNFRFEIENSTTLTLEFTLNKGAYATSLLRELVILRQDSDSSDSMRMAAASR